MSIASEISRLQTAKTALKAAIEGKGVTVPSAAKLDGYAALVDQIQGGGGTIEGGVTYDTFNSLGHPTHADIYPYTISDKLSIPQYMCAYQAYLESVTIHGNVEQIAAYAFNSAARLANIDLPESVTTINNNAFQTCRALALTRLPSGLTSIGATAFMQSGVTFDTIPEGVTALYNQTFQGCSDLTSITVPGLNTASSNSYSAIFRDCTGLRVADLKHPGRIYSNTFNGCTSLDTLIIRQTDAVASVYNTNAFENCPIRTGTGTVYVPQALVNSYKTASNWSTYVSAGTQILPIEGSIYETQYANGQPVAA